MESQTNSKEKNEITSNHVSYGTSVSTKKLNKIELNKVFDAIKSDMDLAKKVDQIRNCDNKEERTKLKVEYLPYFNLGLFKDDIRNNENLEQTEYFTYDYDGLNGTYNECFEKAKSIDIVNVAFKSPSGDGLKVICRLTQPITNHKQFTKVYKHYQEHMDELIGAKSDEKCCDALRPCFFSYDPSLYLNENPRLLTIDCTIYSTNTLTDSAIVLLPNYDNEPEYDPAKIQEIAEYLSTRLQGYDDWLGCGLALASLREKGKDYFQILSQNPNYHDTPEEIDFKFNNLIETKKGTVGLGTLFYIAQKYGFKNNFTHDNININTNHDFWTIRRDDNGKFKIELDMYDFIRFLENKGYGKVYYSIGYMLVKITNNIVSETSIPRKKSSVLDHIKNLNDEMSNHKSELINVLISKCSHYFSENVIECVSSKALDIKQDTKYESKFYYRNSVVTVSKDKGISTDTYENLSGLIWESQILQRNFTIVDDQKSVFEQFLFNICDKSDSRYRSIQSAIGYLLHGYKDSTDAKAIVLCDEKILDTGEPNGRTGKSLFGKALSYMKNAVRFDGRNFIFNKSFAFQQVKLDTQIMEFNDVKRDFDFERLFSILTDSITIEKKNKDEFSIPFEKSPKILVSTNYTIKGTGDSFNARIFEIELSDYYNDKHRPIDDFKKRFFDEWDECEWNRFDNFMLNCLHLYLLEEKLVEQPAINLSSRKLDDHTSPEFVEYIDDVIKLEKEYDKKQKFDDFKDKCGFYKIQQRTFTNWLKIYAKSKGLIYQDRKLNGVTFFTLKKLISNYTVNADKSLNTNNVTIVVDTINVNTIVNTDNSNIVVDTDNVNTVVETNKGYVVDDDYNPYIDTLYNDDL